MAHPDGPDAPNFFMNKFSGVVILLVLVWVVFGSISASAIPTEAALTQQLHSTDWRTVHAALERLNRYYYTSTNEIPLLKEMLRNNTLATNPAVVVKTHNKNGTTETSVPMSKSTPPMYLSRQAARALAIRHASMSEEDLQQVYRFLESPDTETKMDGVEGVARAQCAPGGTAHPAVACG
jgi:hypothetical protein